MNLITPENKIGRTYNDPWGAW